MHISKIKIKNFRLLRDSTLDLRENLSLLVGKNNTGKTSLLVLFENFLHKKDFHYDDFPLALREQIYNLNEDTDIDDLSIRMVLEIEYDENDKLENLSDFILDLDPEIRTAKILFECRIDKNKLLKEVTEVEKNKRKDIIIKKLGRYLKSTIYAFDDSKHDSDDDFFKVSRHKLIKKEHKDISKLIHFNIILARRNVSSSEENHGSKKPLSEMTTTYFNSKNEVSEEDHTKINEIVVKMDGELNKEYDSFFTAFLDNAKTFLNLQNLNVKSNIQSKSLLENSSHVIYGPDDNHLPEHLNGLGSMNILYLLLKIEIHKVDFEKQNKDINLLLIEEPEAHTHPQMQYIFANKVSTVLKEIKGLQTLITSHSSHIVSHSDFEDIRYLKLAGNKNIEIKNFHTELQKKYSDKEEFKFIKHYLNIQSAELFFASKVVFIEGITERILLPYFIKRFDDEKVIIDKGYISLASQNISILEVGANAKAFAPFLEFLDIKTLIITDIDSVEKVIKTTETGEKTSYPAAAVASSTSTSNATLRHFLDSPKDINCDLYKDWFSELRDNALSNISGNIMVVYQKKENGYHARSFEDAFININKEDIKFNKENLAGLKNKNDLNTITDIYALTNSVLGKKSDFAASLLYRALSQESTQWKTPLYIKEGLEWLQEK